MNNYKSFSEIKEELGIDYDFKLYEMGISALKEIENLQQENKKLNGAIQTYDILLKSNVEENKQLKDNWNKLKEYLKSYIKLMNNNPDIIEQGQLDILYEVKDKMQELEGSDSE